ncbi:MAG: DUF1858 domain-containing protein [Actinobacteria bacterium]|nr:DUF1858 domain-containing protein [Actinomycetota bacterium]
MAEKIKKDILIEALVTVYPKSVSFLMDKGVRCIACGEPIWGTLESAAKEKGFSDRDIDKLVVDLEKTVTAKQKERQGR